MPWTSKMNFHQVAGIIERFLGKSSSYPQEWNDFIDTSQSDWKVDAYRKCCYELDPLVNSREVPEAAAIAALSALAKELRNADINQMPVIEKPNRKTDLYWRVGIVALVVLAIIVAHH